MPSRGSGTCLTALVEVAPNSDWDVPNAAYIIHHTVTTKNKVLSRWWRNNMHPQRWQLFRHQSSHQWMKLLELLMRYGDHKIRPTPDELIDRWTHRTTNDKAFEFNVNITSISRPVCRNHSIARQCLYCCKSDQLNLWCTVNLGVSKLENP